MLATGEVAGYYYYYISKGEVDKKTCLCIKILNESSDYISGHISILGCGDCKIL